MPPKKGTKLRSFTIPDETYGDETFRENDCVLVKSGKPLQFIGKIKEIEDTGSNRELRTISVRVEWFYRPEEALGGRKTFHGAKELFRSNHGDSVKADTVEGKCRVHTLKAYQELRNVTEEDFFARFSYEPTLHQFKPDQVPVYCKCEMPYNPDAFMVMCEQCREWFHPECVGLSEADIKKMENYKCRDCKAVIKTTALLS